MNSAIDNLFAQQAQQQQKQQQQFPADIANFNLIAATNKTSPRAPDFFGSTKINGSWFMLSAWLIFSRSGKQMINTANASSYCSGSTATGSTASPVCR